MYHCFCISVRKTTRDYLKITGVITIKLAKEISKTQLHARLVVLEIAQLVQVDIGQHPKSLTTYVIPI